MKILDRKEMLKNKKRLMSLGIEYKGIAKECWGEI